MNHFDMTPKHCKYQLNERQCEQITTNDSATIPPGKDFFFFFSSQVSGSEVYFVAILAMLHFPCSQKQAISY